VPVHFGPDHPPIHEQASKNKSGWDGQVEIEVSEALSNRSPSHEEVPITAIIDVISLQMEDTII
jgi:hypothetical protein